MVDGESCVWSALYFGGVGQTSEHRIAGVADDAVPFQSDLEPDRICFERACREGRRGERSDHKGRSLCGRRCSYGRGDRYLGYGSGKDRSRSDTQVSYQIEPINKKDPYSVRIFFALHIFEFLRLKNRSAFVACDDEVIYKMDLQGV